MNGPIFRPAVELVRAWTWVYTLPLAPLDRAGRRDEIASDLWEFEADQAPHAGSFSAAAHVLARAALGIPADLLWTFERLTTSHRPVRTWTIIRAAVVVIATATVVASANGPALDPARALKVNVEAAGWLPNTIRPDRSGSAFAPAVAFTLTNIGEQSTAALQVNAVFLRRDDEANTLGLGTAFAQVVGWRGLARHATSARVLLRGQPLYVIDALSARRAAVPFDRLDAAHVRLFVHHEGRWAFLGDCVIPALPLSR